MRYRIVDVFTETPFEGNPLAVFWDIDKTLSQSDMQSIAREMNLSETTFVTTWPDKEGLYSIRIFTPKQELPFAGHPTLGTFAVLREMGLVGDQGTQQTAAGRTRVVWADEGPWMAPPAATVRPVPLTLKDLLHGLGLDGLDTLFDPSLPPVLAGTD